MTPAVAATDDRVNQAELHRRRTPGDRTLLELECVEAVATSEFPYALATVLPGRPPRSPGRPRLYPSWVPLVHLLLTGLVGSHSGAARILANPQYWIKVRKIALARGEEQAPEQPPQKWHSDYWRRTMRGLTGELLGTFEEQSAILARRLGCLDPDVPYSHTAPKRGQYIVGDGTVVKAPVRKDTADRWNKNGRRVDASLQKENGEEGADFAFGSKFVLLHTRPNSTRNLRIVLSLLFAPPGGGYGGEAQLTTDKARALAARPDLSIHGICYDGAFRGKHTDQLMKSGLTVLSPMHRGMKTTPLEQQQCRCGDTHDLVLRGGQPHEIEVTDRGEQLLSPCPRGRILRRANSDGTYRWYQEIAAKCGTLKLIRIDNTDDDRRRGFKRSEHFRQHVPTPGGDSVYDRCYGWREDAESCHNILDRTLYGGRMISFDTPGQILVMLGFAAGRNAIAEYLHHRDQHLCQPTAA